MSIKISQPDFLLNQEMYPEILLYSIIQIFLNFAQILFENNICQKFKQPVRIKKCIDGDVYTHQVLNLDFLELIPSRFKWKQKIYSNYCLDLLTFPNKLLKYNFETMIRRVIKIFYIKKINYIPINLNFMKIKEIFKGFEI